MEYNELEYNKLCCRFIGGKFKGETFIPLNDDEVWLPIFGVCKISIDNGKHLEFHKNWNWIMIILQKIYETNLYYEEYISQNSSQFSNGKIELSTDKKEVVEQIWQFLQFYNKHNKL